jgi:hypothetical protein
MCGSSIVCIASQAPRRRSRFHHDLRRILCDRKSENRVSSCLKESRADMMSPTPLYVDQASIIFSNVCNTIAFPNAC